MPTRSVCERVSKLIQEQHQSNVSLALGDRRLRQQTTLSADVSAIQSPFQNPSVD